MQNHACGNDTALYFNTLCAQPPYVIHTIGLVWGLRLGQGKYPGVLEHRSVTYRKSSTTCIHASFRSKTWYIGPSHHTSCITILVSRWAQRNRHGRRALRVLDVFCIKYSQKILFTANVLQEFNTSQLLQIIFCEFLISAFTFTESMNRA